MENLKGAEINCEDDYFTEPLYSVLLTARKNDEEKFSQLLKATGFSVDKIGVVTGETLQWRDLKVTAQEIKRGYESVWQKNFPRLS